MEGHSVAYLCVLLFRQSGAESLLVEDGILEHPHLYMHAAGSQHEQPGEGGDHAHLLEGRRRDLGALVNERQHDWVQAGGQDQGLWEV